MRKITAYLMENGKLFTTERAARDYADGRYSDALKGAARLMSTHCGTDYSKAVEFLSIDFYQKVLLDMLLLKADMQTVEGDSPDQELL